MASSPLRAAACTTRERAYRSGSQPGSAPNSAERSKPPKISARAAGVEAPADAAAPIRAAFSSPRAVSMMGTRGTSSPSKRCAPRTPSTVVTLGIMKASGRVLPTRAAASRRPSSESGSLTRTMRWGRAAGDISPKKRTTEARASAFLAGATASSRSMHTASAPAASAFA